VNATASLLSSHREASQGPFLQDRQVPTVKKQFVTESPSCRPIPVSAVTCKHQSVTTVFLTISKLWLRRKVATRMTSEVPRPSSEPASESNASQDQPESVAPPPPYESAHGEPSQPDENSPTVSIVPSVAGTEPDPVSGGPESNDESPPSGAATEEEEEDGKDNETDATAESAGDEIAKRGVGVKGRVTSLPIVSTSKKNRPPYKYDPSKITLRFLFANRDGLTVTIECEPSDTVGEVKTSLLSVWPRGK
jgi:hypothetical protein